MGEQRYVISQVVKMTKIKSHTIRYWEDELGLTIDRNNMGHRCYSQKDIDLIIKINDLKERGFQLRAIKMMLPEIDRLAELDNETLHRLKEQIDAIDNEDNYRSDSITIEPTQPYDINLDDEINVEEDTSFTNTDISDVDEHIVENRVEDKSRESSQDSDNTKMQKVVQFKNIMMRLVVEALEENSNRMAENITVNVTDKVIKEMDYLFRVKEEREEERYRKLDELIRGVQKSRQEVAASSLWRRRKKHPF